MKQERIPRWTPPPESIFRQNREGGLFRYLCSFESIKDGGRGRRKRKTHGMNIDIAKAVVEKTAARLGICGHAFRGLDERHSGWSD